MKSVVVLFVLVPAMLAVTRAAPQLAPLRYMDTETAIKGEYIVVFKKAAEDFHFAAHKTVLRKMLNNATSAITREYHIGRGFRGYAAKLTDEEVKKIQAMDYVNYIAANQVVKISQSCLQQTGATWGIVRTTQRDNEPGEPYQYKDADGEGVSVYIIDTGLYIEHNEFGGRASYGFDSVSDPPLYRDGNGHGTHVASTILGQEYGLARKATAIGVRVLGDGGSGTYEGVIAGIDWTADEHEKSDSKKSVANMSLGGLKYDPVDDAVDAAVERGVHFSISAGNDNSDACGKSPAASELSLTVGSTDNQDKRSSFSNYGKCVDIFAPGSSITGAWIGSPSATNTISGTSMAAPHVGGVMAKLLSQKDYTPEELKIFVKAISTKEKVENIPDDESPNELVFADCES